MKKFLKILVLILAVAFIGIQFIRPDRSVPTTNQPDTLEFSAAIPDNVKDIVSRSCNDCHSNSTVYPWYSNIAPSSWFLQDHIDSGRRRLNFSTWNTYENNKKRRNLQKVCEEAEQHQMPLPSYLWVHWDAKLSDEQIKILCDWTEAERTRLEKQGGAN